MPVTIIGSGKEPELFIRSGAARIIWGQTIKFRAEQGIAEGKIRLLSPGCYMNCRILPSHPVEWGRLIHYLHVASRAFSFDTVASVETGAVPHGVALALRYSQMPHVSIKKEAKTHGMAGLIAGDLNAVEGKRVIVIEDVGTTGESSRRAVEVLKDHGAKVVGVLLLATYNFPDLRKTSRELGVSFYALCSFEWILETLVKQGEVKPAHERMIRSWLQDPWKWSASPSWV